MSLSHWHAHKNNITYAVFCKTAQNQYICQSWKWTKLLTASSVYNIKYCQVDAPKQLNTTDATYVILNYRYHLSLTFIYVNVPLITIFKMFSSVDLSGQIKMKLHDAPLKLQYLS